MTPAIATAPVSRDERHFILIHAREAFMRAKNRVATLPALRTLLDITRDLLAWQEEHDRQVFYFSKSHKWHYRCCLSNDRQTQEKGSFLRL